MKENTDKLSIIFPVYNERDTLEVVLQEWVKELKKQKITYQFIVCEDGSTDGTKELLIKIKNKYKLTLSMAKDRIGYGGAILSGIKLANTKFVLFVDSDGQFDPKDFPKFWKLRNDYDIVKGWRVKRIDPFNRKLYSGVFKMSFIILFGNKSNDPSIGYVLFKRNKILLFVKDLTYLKEGFGWNFTAAAVKNNLTFKEIPVKNRKRLKGNTNVYKLKKIPSIAARNLFGMVKLRFNK